MTTKHARTGRRERESGTGQRVAPPVVSEHEEQVTLFAWAKAMEPRLPALELLFAVPNGGARHIATAIKMRQEGLRAGVPDVWLPIPRAEWHGLIIEMKVGRNRPTQEQWWWLENLMKHGYCTDVCYGWLAAARRIVTYLGHEPRDYGL